MVAARTAVRAAANLADPSTCTDVRALARSRWAEDVDDRRVAELRQRLARADAIAAVGRPADALEIDDAVAAEAVALGLAALGAETALARGRHLSELDRLPEAEAALGQAYFDALRLGDDATAARAALWQVRTVGNRLGRHDEGLTWGLHAAALLERSGTASALDRAALDVQIAAVLREQGEFDRAVALDRSALATRAEILGEDHPDVADSLDNLGNVLHLLRDDAGAASAQRRGLEIRERVFGPWHPLVASSLNNLANVELAARRFEVAEPLLVRALEIGEAELGTDNADVAAALANLGSVSIGVGRYEEAERYYRRGLAIEERILGSDHHEVAGSYANLASALIGMGDHRAAAEYLERASTIARRRLDATHPLLAIIDFNLGLARVRLGEYAAAEAALRSAAAIPSTDVDSIDLKAAVQLATVLRLQGRLDEAAGELDRAETKHANRQAPLANFSDEVALERGQIAAARTALDRGGPVRRR
jgi:tetratricopeptide (TPR) repeat protein